MVAEWLSLDPDGLHWGRMAVLGAAYLGWQTLPPSSRVRWVVRPLIVLLVLVAGGACGIPPTPAPPPDAVVVEIAQGDGAPGRFVTWVNAPTGVNEGTGPALALYEDGGGTIRALPVQGRIGWHPAVCVAPPRAATDSVPRRWGTLAGAVNRPPETLPTGAGTGAIVLAFQDSLGVIRIRDVHHEVVTDSPSLCPGRTPLSLVVKRTPD